MSVIDIPSGELSLYNMPSVVFSPDGTYVAAAAIEDSKLAVFAFMFDASTGTLEYNLRLDNNVALIYTYTLFTNAIAIDNDNRILLGYSDDDGTCFIVSC
jgi:hypothetical protein